MTSSVIESITPLEFEEISISDAKVMFSSKVKDLLGIDTKTFVANYEAGKYSNSEDEAVLELIMLLPFIRD